MTRAVAFRPQAEDEALAVRRWYEARRPGLGDEFGAELDSAVARIAKTPLAYPRVRGEARRAVLNRFPYALYFRLTAEDIIVPAVQGRQDPSRWQSARSDRSMQPRPGKTRGLTRHAADGADGIEVAAVDASR